MSLAEFHEARLPLALAFGASGGPERRTEIVELASGGEARNAVWAGSKRRWDLAGAVQRLSDLQALVAFFEARRGRLHGFRFRDPIDHSSGAPGAGPGPADQALGVGDGARAVFPLVKAYGDYERRIVKPVAGTVRVAVGGAELSSGFSVDTTTGEVAFETAPAAGAGVTAGFEFDTPVRFDADRLETTLDAFGAGRAVSVPIIEIPG